MGAKRFCKVFFGFLALSAFLGLSSGDIWADGITFDKFFSLGRVSDPQISPDGKHVAFVVTWYSKETNGGNSDIYLVPIKGLEKGAAPAQLTNSPGRDSQPRFSPDGGRIIASRQSSTRSTANAPTNRSRSRAVSATP